MQALCVVIVILVLSSAFGNVNAGVVVPRPDGVKDSSPASKAVVVDAGVPSVDASALSAPDAGGFPDGGEENEEDEESADDETDMEEEGEAEQEVKEGVVADGGLHYSADISDEDLKARWTSNLPSLGSISVGFVDQGRLINGKQMPEGKGWSVVCPELAYGTEETVNYLEVALTAVHEQFPQSAPIRVNHMSKQEGGYLRPHQTHQSGRDVDLSLYYKNDVMPGRRAKREHFIDPARNWALVKALATLTDAQVIIVDKRIQKVLYEHALAHGEDRAWLDNLFHAGSNALVKHARRHRDHFHVRFYSPRSQELGRRVQPLLAQRPDQYIVVYRVRRGDTLGHIARRHNTTIHAIMKANHMRKSFIRAGRTILVPLRGPCVRCPQPAPLVLPPRRLPPVSTDGGVPTVMDAGLAPDAAPPAQADAGQTAPVVQVGPPKPLKEEMTTTATIGTGVR